MNNLQASQSRKIQKQHIRRYDTGKVTLVNKGVHRQTYYPNHPISRAKKDNFYMPNTPKTHPINPIRPAPSDEREREKMIEDTAAAILFPTIAFSGQEGAYPSAIKDKIQTARLTQLMKDHKDFREYATDEEALGYISTMSLIAPLDRDMVNIMSYLFTKVMGSRTPDDLRTPTINPQEMNLLKRLKADIRKTQWEVFRKRVDSK